MTDIGTDLHLLKAAARSNNHVTCQDRLTFDNAKVIIRIRRRRSAQHSNKGMLENEFS